METTTLSCIQPTGVLHVGNLFGAVDSWVASQESEAQRLYGIVDYHALTTLPDASSLRRDTLNTARCLLACGIAPGRSTVFLQSSVGGLHTELAWILSCFTNVSELTRMTQFKEKSKRGSPNAGLFTYPVLMSADIGLYGATQVPVGHDQLQHLELARTIFRRFNRQCGEEVLPLPTAELTPTPRVMSLLDPHKKMSKSDVPRSYIGVAESAASIRAKIRGALTDSTGPGAAESAGVANLLGLLSAAAGEPEMEEARTELSTGGLAYSRLKDLVADRLVRRLEPVRLKYESTTEDQVRAILAEGGAKARTLADVSGDENPHHFGGEGGASVVGTGLRIKVSNDVRGRQVWVSPSRIRSPTKIGLFGLGAVIPGCSRHHQSPSSRARIDHSTIRAGPTPALGGLGAPGYSSSTLTRRREVSSIVRWRQP